MSLEEKKFKTNTVVWSDKVEKVISDIQVSCEGYKWMNLYSAGQLETRFTILMYLLIVIGPISGILSSVATFDYQKYRDLQNVITVFSFLSGVLSAVAKFTKFQERCITHKSMASKYASLEANIRRQLSLNREDRVNAGEYLEWCSIMFDELFSSTPLMSPEILSNWVEYGKKQVNSSINLGSASASGTGSTTGSGVKPETEVVSKSHPATEAEPPSTVIVIHNNKLRYELERMKRLSS